MKKRNIWASLHPFYESGPALGRVEANRGFIRALLAADPFDAYHFFLRHPNDVEFLAGQLQAEFPQMREQGRFALRLRRDFARAVAADDYHCLHLSDPFTCYSEAMSLRNAFSRRIFPIAAPTHSLSYAEYGAEFLKHLWPGATARDAVLATSSAGVRVVENYYGHLKSMYGAAPSPKVRLMPLGVDPADFPAPGEKAALGQKARERHGFGGDIVFLVFARLSYQSKMDVLPILRAFKRAEAEGLELGSARLVLAGWLDDGDNFGADMQRLAAGLGIKCSLVPRPDNAVRKALYAAADVFLSPADNLQETFGLTMLEAAASGLPIVASDFDGYKDLVRDGVSGCLIPSYGPEAAPATDLLSSMVPASEYHLLLAQQCAVDVGEMGRALARLAGDAALRQGMGRAGRERVLRDYTWSAIVRRHLELWDELNAAPCELDTDAAVRPREQCLHPMHPPFMSVFGDYFRRRLSGHDELVWTAAGEAVYRGRDFPVIYGLLEERLDLDELKKILFLARKPVSLAALRRETSDEAAGGPQDADFLVLWALKHDLLALARP